MPDNLVLEGPNVLLREVETSDVNENYHRWMNDPEVNKYMETRFRSQSVEDIRDYVRKMNGAPDIIFLAIIYKKGNSHIGNIKLGPISKIHRRGEISFFIGEKRLWGKGLASEAVDLLTNYALEEIGLVKVTAGCYSSNSGSNRVFEKLGYVVEGVQLKHYFCEGKLEDRICRAKFQSEKK